MFTSAVIIALLKAAESFFNFLCTDQGQSQVAEWRADRAKLATDFAGILGWLKNLIQK
jgi:hypothetical protein